MNEYCSETMACLLVAYSNIICGNLCEITLAGSALFSNTPATALQRTTTLFSGLSKTFWGTKVMIISQSASFITSTKFETALAKFSFLEV